MGSQHPPRPVVRRRGVQATGGWREGVSTHVQERAVLGTHGLDQLLHPLRLILHPDGELQALKDVVRRKGGSSRERTKDDDTGRIPKCILSCYRVKGSVLEVYTHKNCTEDFLNCKNNLPRHHRTLHFHPNGTPPVRPRCQHFGANRYRIQKLRANFKNVMGKRCWQAKPLNQWS